MRTLVLVDADDTLWENNRWFLTAIDRWCAALGAVGVPRDDALVVLEACEDRNIPRTGYGAAPFAESLREAWRLLRPHADGAERERAEDLAARLAALIRDHPIVLLPGVAEALPALALRADLVLFTKGQDEEQRGKLARSGLAAWFTDVRVVPEKTRDVYAAECAARGVPPETAWMVGNSPRSDVNPARRAGLRTVLVPHAAPWHRELEELDADGPPTRIAGTFADVPRLVSD